MVGWNGSYAPGFIKDQAWLEREPFTTVGCALTSLVYLYSGKQPYVLLKIWSLVFSGCVTIEYSLVRFEYSEKGSVVRESKG